MCLNLLQKKRKGKTVFSQCVLALSSKEKKREKRFYTHLSSINHPIAGMQM